MSRNGQAFLGSGYGAPAIPLGTDLWGSLGI
jgi:hypothetical protein